MRKASLRNGVLTAAIALTVAMVARPAFAVEEVDIGVTAASNPSAKGYPPGSVGRLLGIGVRIVGDERIITNEDGRAQLLFLDHSALTIGPNSDVVLDKFIYDPDAGTGDLAFSAVKGVFRLVGGKISKKTPVTIKTPTATISIRGGIAIIAIEDDGSAEAMFLFGEDMTVFSDCKTVTATRPGSSVKFDSPCNILDPVILAADRLSRIIQQLEPPPTQPSDLEVKDAVLGALTEPAAGPNGTPPPTLPPALPFVCISCVNPAQNLPPPPPPPPPLPLPLLPTGNGFLQ